MQAAKKAVSEFVSHGGHHKTTVDETVNRAVTNEQVHSHRHENVTTAVDKEIHQDHHHTTVQPLKDRKVLAEEHTHNMRPVEHKTFNHNNESEVRAALEREHGKFRDTSIKHDTTTSASHAPTIESERIHHHVHEHVQPVIERDVIANKVVHTTVPIHETHIAAAEHHGTSVLPAKTLDEFRSSKGVLDGRGKVGLTEFEGCPKPYNKEFQTERLDGDKSMHLNAGVGGHHSHSHTGTAATAGTGAGVLNSRDTHGSHSTRTGMAATGAAGAAGLGAAGVAKHHNRRGSNSSSSSDETRRSSKPSLMEKLNPFKDADGDGKKGMMD